MNVDTTPGNKRMDFDALAALHVRDLFEGSATPARRGRGGRGMKKGRKMAARKVEPAAPVERVEPPKHYDRITCPCCQQRVEAPSLDVVIDHYGLTPLQARILGATWRGKGMPVQTERIFDAMYADDPDGGPSYTLMYKSFKVALCRLRMRLRGSGVSIKNVGYGRGYRLVLGEK